MPMNYLIILALENYHKYFQDELQVELPTNSGNMVNLKTVADDLCKRITSIFEKDPEGNRLLHGKENSFYANENCKDLLLFYECFHGDNCRGVGASHQTGWTGIIAEIIRKLNF